LRARSPPHVRPGNCHPGRVFVPKGLIGLRLRRAELTGVR
jgi:hypothetical protein